MTFKHSHTGLLAIMFGALLLSSGCSWDKKEVPAPPNVVSFSTDIIPIFNTSCNASCHPGGGSQFDLSEANAYSSLWNTPGMIDTANAQESILYKRMTGTAGLIMPVSGQLDQYKTDLVLAWIEDGAQDN